MTSVDSWAIGSAGRGKERKASDNRPERFPVSYRQETYFKQLVWKYDPNAIASEFSADWSRLAEHPLVCCQVNREPISGKGRYQSLDLRNIRTVYPAHGRDRGSFVSIYRKEHDISLVWPANLGKAKERGFISEHAASVLLTLFEAFHRSYSGAIDGFIEDGLASDHLVKQAEDYGALLSAICIDAKGDRNRENLLRPLLQIGTVAVEGGRVTAIVAPWHPLRLSAMANKTLQVASLARHLLTADKVFFGDPPLFFKELKEELSHPYYPEIVLGWHAMKPELLSLTDRHLDYSLHESPVISNDGYDDTNESPSETASLIVDLTKRFLALYPHERANLSVVLYNCDSARLPYALVDKMNELHEDEEDMRCQIILRHRDGMKLRELYEKIIESSDADADSFVSSEAAKDFMARLRIGIMADQAPVPDPKDGPPADIVFLQDVIARHAGLEWYRACDDYAEWLGQREEQIADILAISPEQTQDGQLNLAVIIAESKYIDVASVATKRKESRKQLRDTVRRINDAIFGDPQRLDRDLWLSRFSDLMLNGIQFPANSPIDLAAWRKAVREGECFI